MNEDQETPPSEDKLPCIWRNRVNTTPWWCTQRIDHHIYPDVWELNQSKNTLHIHHQNHHHQLHQEQYVNLHQK